MLFKSKANCHETSVLQVPTINKNSYLSHGYINELWRLAGLRVKSMGNPKYVGELSASMSVNILNSSWMPLYIIHTRIGRVHTRGMQQQSDTATEESL